MAYITINGANIHCTDEGSGSEALVFSHGLLVNSLMFENLVSHFKGDYRCATYYHRGQVEPNIPEANIALVR